MSSDGFCRVPKEQGCDMCGFHNFKELLILRKDKFIKKSWNHLTRVCWSCAKELAKKQIYRFSPYWCEMLLGLRWEEIVMQKRGGRYTE